MYIPTANVDHLLIISSAHNTSRNLWAFHFQRNLNHRPMDSAGQIPPRFQAPLSFRVILSTAFKNAFAKRPLSQKLKWECRKQIFMLCS
jgi:hypothetical protein